MVEFLQSYSTFKKRTGRMSENDFDLDLIDVQSIDDFFFLCPEMIHQKNEILYGILENDKRCLEEEITMKQNRTPQGSNRRSLLKTVSRTATITKRRPEIFSKFGGQTEIRQNHQLHLQRLSSDPFFDESVLTNLGNNTYTLSPANATQQTYTVSPPRPRYSGIAPSNGSFFDASFHNIDLDEISMRRNVMSDTYDIEKNEFQPATFIEESFTYEHRLPPNSRTSSSETFTKACDLNSLADSTFETVSNIDNTTSNGPTSLSSEDLSVSDQASTTAFNRYSTYSKLKNQSARNIPLSFSSNLSSVSSVTGGSESSLNSGLRMFPGRLARAIGTNGSQTISRGKIMPPTKYTPSSVVVSQIAAVPKQIPRASNMIRPKTLSGSRIRLPTNGTH